ncbi:MAG: CRISPR-associated ring nuclease [Runella sp.]
MIVVQAFLMCPDRIHKVHIITTDNPRLEENYNQLFNFFRDYPNVIFTLTAIEGLVIPNTTKDQELFEEALFQWYILYSTPDHLPLVCLSGGTKTIPSTMQKAAQYFGAADCFHVLVENPLPSNPQEVKEAKQNGRIQYVSLGKELGWLPLRMGVDKKKFATCKIDERGISYIAKPDQLIVRNHIKRLLAEVYRRAEGQAEVLPFQSLALLPAMIQDFLRAPLELSDRDWLERLPKVELHCHLGGFATQPPLLEEVVAAAKRPITLKSVPSPPADWPLPADCISLDAYMRLGDSNGSNLLKDEGCLQHQIELLYQHLCEQNVRYAEIRCSPDNYTLNHRTAWDVLQDIRGHFQRLMDSVQDSESRCHVNLIVIATRKTEGDLSSISRHLALAITAAQQTRNLPDTTCKVVGVDLAGYESRYSRASYFSADFMGVHRCGLAVTAHAGENDDAEGIWQAVYQLHARRLGHALHLWQAPDLLQTVIDRHIGVEMCPYANYQIKGFEPMEGKPKYPLSDYLRKGVLVTVNTDNIGISDANLTDNFLLLIKLCPDITRLEVLQLIRNALEVAFVGAFKRASLIKLFEKQVFNTLLNLKLS